jgi:hypothetical protein
VVDITTAGADAHIDWLAYKYLGVDSYPKRRPGEVRIRVTVRTDHIAMQPNQTTWVLPARPGGDGRA